MKIAAIVVAVLLVLGAIAWAGVVAFRGGFAGAAAAPKVRVEPAVRGSLVQVVSVPGEVQPRRRVSISARIPARIAELPHAEGAEVIASPQGTTRPSERSVLVRLDARDLEAALVSARERSAAQVAQIQVEESRIAAQLSTVAGSKAVLADAERDMRRKRGLAETFDVAQSEADTAVARFDELTAQLQSAEHSLLAARQNVVVLRHQQKASEAEILKAQEDLSYTTIASPIDGVVTKVKAEVGEQVVPGIQGSPGSVILEVADLADMLMVARVDEANVAAVKPGQAATVRVQAFREETFRGVVESVGLAKADPSSGGSSARSSEGANYYEAKIKLATDPKRRIPTGLSADADIETSRVDGVKVPSQAVVGRQADAIPVALRPSDAENDRATLSVVYRYANGKAVATPVKTGPSDETHTVILSGLAEGDAVIVGPYKVLDTVAHDQAVTKEDSAPRAASRPATTAASMPTSSPTAAK